MLIFAAVKMTSPLPILLVELLCLLYLVDVAVNEVIEYKRSGSCNFVQECVYKYHTEQYTLGEKDKEKISFSTDVNWHCESSGLYGSQPATEYCFALSNANVTFSVGSNLSSMINYTTNAQKAFLMDRLKGEFCYVQTRNGKIVSIHYSPTEDEEAVNIKRGIAGAFQANFDHREKVKESDPGSTHISHYSYAKTSDKVVSFTRSFQEGDLIKIAGGASKDSLVYAKTEKSTFINRILYRSRGMLRVKVDFGDNQNPEPASDTFNPNFDFSDEFQTNGTYILERVYCKQRNKRSLVFRDLASPDVQKGFLSATINLTNFDQYRIKKIRDAIPSIPGFIENLRRNTNNTELVESCKTLLELESKYSPLDYTTTINQIIDYYKKIQISDKVEDVEIRKIIYSLFSFDGSEISQKVLGSALLRRKRLSKEERSALLYEIALVKNANLDLVNTVISSISSNNDAIILVLGALAKDNNLAIQKVVIGEIVRRLNTLLSFNDTGKMTTLVYALGNTESKLAVSYLLPILEFNDIEIQISALRSLATHLDLAVVQKRIVGLLSTDEDKILEETLKILIEAFRNMILTSPSKELLIAITNSAIKLENPNLYELLEKYLHQLKANGIDIYLEVLKQQHNYGEVQHDHISDLYKNDSRIKRGSDWDQQYSDYDVVASYSQRRSDVINYPSHRAYIWGKTFGEDKLRLKVGAGAFAGQHVNTTSIRLKFYSKVAANIEVFGIPIKVVDIETSGKYASGNTLDYRTYILQGNTVGVNDNKAEKLGSDLKKFTQSISRSKQIFYRRWPIFVYAGTVNVHLQGSLTSQVNFDLGAKASIQSLNAEVNLGARLSFSLRVSGGASTSLLEAVRGGIEVGATFSYHIQPKLNIKASVEFQVIKSDTGSGSDDEDLAAVTKVPIIESKTCNQLYNGWNVYGEIYPWYQFRSISVSWRGVRISWGSKQKWDELHRKWNVYGSNRLVWSSCSS